MLATVSVGAAISVPATSEAERSETERPAAGVEAISMNTQDVLATVSAGDTPDALGAVADVDAAVTAYLDGEHERMVAEWVAGVERAQAEAAAAARARTTTRASSAPRSSPGTTVGACTGFAIPDYIIQRESGGNPSAYNPSGAYGCAQTLLSHYSGGSCSGLDPYSIDGQRACVDILSNGGTNLNPWAATR